METEECAEPDSNTLTFKTNKKNHNKLCGCWRKRKGRRADRKYGKPQGEEGKVREREREKEKGGVKRGKGTE